MEHIWKGNPLLLQPAGLTRVNDLLVQLRELIERIERIERKKSKLTETLI